MRDQSNPLPKDAFSIALRQLTDDPGALHARSTVQSSDFYGNVATWVVDTFRAGSDETVFVQCSSAEQPLRLVLPIQVTRALARQREQVAQASRRRSGHNLIALRKQRGDTLGNPAALAAARRKRGRK